MQDQELTDSPTPTFEEGDDAQTPEEPEQQGGDDVEYPDNSPDSPGIPAPPVVRDPRTGRELPCEVCPAKGG